MLPSEKKNFLLNNTGSPSSMPCSLRVLDGSTQLTKIIISQYLIKWLSVQIHNISLKILLQIATMPYNVYKYIKLNSSHSVSEVNKN